MSTTTIISRGSSTLANCHQENLQSSLSAVNRRPRLLPSVIRSSANNNKHGLLCFSRNQRLYLFNTNPRRPNTIIKMDLNAVENLIPGSPAAPLPSGSPFPGWLNWTLLTIIPLLLPIFKNKWAPLLAFKKQVETAIETVETISEVIEEVAVGVDKIADEVAESLPDGSKLKEIVCKLDEVAEGVIKTADFTQDIINKVEEAGDALETQLQNSSNNNLQNSANNEESLKQKSKTA
ncbi:hypothetical protein Syun_004801 [Stephania yunnanensis]|uniref:Uncharacterized protein n=1 Tax=Stephania yunnanensis TaxID=152371 RepID=A0AAP0Q2W2_9MAGN